MMFDDSAIATILRSPLIWGLTVPRWFPWYKIWPNVSMLKHSLMCLPACVSVCWVRDGCSPDDLAVTTVQGRWLRSLRACRGGRLLACNTRHLPRGDGHYMCSRAIRPSYRQSRFEVYKWHHCLWSRWITVWSIDRFVITIRHYKTQ